MDAAACRDGDGTIDRRALSPRPCVEDPWRHAMVAATTGQASQRARPGESEVLANAEVAGFKKTLAAEKLGSSSKTRAVSRSVPPSVEPGRRKAKRRS